MGPMMLDLSGYELTAEEKEKLQHPLLGGIILFSRNYYDKPQIIELVRQTRQFARNKLLIAVDHEGGRVQRFRDGFSAIPAMGSLYQKADCELSIAQNYAYQFGWLMAAELLDCDIDISFAPVLDINGVSDVIGDRSFHESMDCIVPLASEFMRGMRSAGMKTTGKHFPGHGNVKEDSHIAMPIDKRPKEDIFSSDMAIFKMMQQRDLLDAVMPAHVIYPDVDELPAGFSEKWVKQILRGSLGFDGVVFSDDLSMQGAAHIGSFVERAEAALNAGCDMVLVCNDVRASDQVLDGIPSNYTASPRIARMCKAILSGEPLVEQAQYQTALRALDTFYG
jgi:beta-N-acetylhexosaminidase